MTRTHRVKKFFYDSFVFEAVTPSEVAACPKLHNCLHRGCTAPTSTSSTRCRSIGCADEFETLRADFEADWNRAHFRWEDDAIDLTTIRSGASSTSFSIARRSASSPAACSIATSTSTSATSTLQTIYKCMSRDEARHSSFLNYVMRQMGRRFDLANLPKIKGLQYMHPKWIFVTTYLSEVVGFYRYQNIADHLKLHPEYEFHPIFRYFDKWCRDERRHARFFSLMLRSQPEYLRGARNRLAIKFFTFAVYITMYLRDSESQRLRRLGIDWEKFDRKVINETERAAQEVWGLGIRTDSKFFLSCLRHMARNNAANKRGRAARGASPDPGTADALLALRQQRTASREADGQPHDDIAPPERMQWTEACPMPAATPTIESTLVAPVRLQNAAVSEAP